MATRAKTNGTRNDPAKPRYWISFDFGLTASYGEFYEWLDAKDASECGIGVATFTSNLSRDEISAEIKEVLRSQNRPRVYLISMKHGGRFILGSRKSAPWTGYAAKNASVVDEV